MLFNSIDFAIFLPIVFILYWFVTSKNLRLQNLFVVAASYLFYGWWDWRFLSLILFSTVVDYSVGIGLSKQEDPFKRKLLLWTSILVNLGFLGVFKYYNFFLHQFVSGFSLLGADFTTSSLNIILPVGISFYTFQTLSYTIDVYKRKLQPTRDFTSFAAFVAFFPQLVAGPIERATNLLPQFTKKRKFDYEDAVDGLRQALWGLFKKMVIADNCAEFANIIFDNSSDYSGSTLILGAVFFAFQIYGDFSGYSDIAIGTSRLFGFKLQQNFAFPYFSLDIAEFWRRWHISLSTWFRDYLYIPLGGSRGSTWMKVRNTFIIFIVSGFWHGANWTFIVWGALNAIYFLPLLLSNKNRTHLNTVARDSTFPSIREFLNISMTFSLTLLAWIFFRAADIQHALTYVRDLFSGLFDKSAYVETLDFIYWQIGLMLPLMLLFFLIIEWRGRFQIFPLAGVFRKRNRWLRYFFYYLVIIAILLWGGKEQQFIYFQF